MAAPMGNSENNKVTDYGFNIEFFRRFRTILKIVFPTVKSITALLFVAVLALQFLEQYLVYQVGLIPSQYYTVLGSKDQEGFRNTTLKALGQIIAIAFVLATDKFTCGVFYVTSRQIITKDLHRRYFKNVLYYHINVLDNSIDNPDQRITQDVDKMCRTFSEIIARLLITPFLIAYYTYKTWINTGYIGPLCVVMFFLISTICNKFLMSPVVKLVYKQDQQEGDFRFKHMQIRSNAESAAFFRSGRIEMNKTNQKLDSLIATQQRLIYKDYFLTFSIKMADYVGSILSYIVVAIPIFAGWYDDLDPVELSSLISKNSFVTMYLIYTFTQLIDMASKVTEMAGAAHRIGHMMERLQYIEDRSFFDSASNSFSDMANSITSPVYTDSSASLEQSRTAYKVTKLTYGPPGSDCELVKDLTFEVQRGINLMVTGDSGCGKSSLLRVLDCLWPVRAGEVERDVCHGHTGVLYLPQKPFFTNGSLREQIVYPYQSMSAPHNLEDHQLIGFLKDVDLGGLLERVGVLDLPVDWNWYDILSPGEMQRLSFVRLFYHKPPFAVLDEATSQVGQDMEEKLYKMCADMQITLISVGHRLSLRKYHQMELHIGGQGQWTYRSIASKDATGASGDS